MVDDTSERVPPERDDLHEDSDVIPLHEPSWREMQEPRDGHEPTPTWLIFFFMAVLGWCGWYLGTYGGQFRSDVYIENAVGVPAASRQAAAAQAPAMDPMVLGRRIYNTCTACHQKDGRGITGTYPPLAGSEIVLGPAEVPAAVVIHGLEGPITIEDRVYDNSMPPWGHLSDEYIAAVLTYVRASFGNGAGAVTRDTVAAVREATSSRSGPWTAAALQSFEASLPLPGGDRAQAGAETATAR